MDKIFNINLNGETYEIQDKPLSEQVAALQGEVAGKLDATAYTKYDDTQVKADIQANTTAIEGKQDKGNYALSGTSYTKAESDAKYLTEHQSLTDYAKKSDVNTELAKKQDKGDYVSATTLNDYAKKADIPNTSEFITSAYTYDKATIDSSLDNKADKKHEHDIDDVSIETSVFNSYYYSGENVKYDWNFYNGIFIFATSPMDFDIFDKNASITLYFDRNKTKYIKLVPYEEVGQVIWKVTDYNYQYFDSSWYYQPKHTIEEFSSTKIEFTNRKSGTIYYAKVENYEGKIGYVSFRHTNFSSKFNEVKNSLTDLSNNKADKSEIPTIPLFKTINGQAITGSTDNITIESGSDIELPISSDDVAFFSDDLEVKSELHIGDTFTSRYIGFDSDYGEDFELVFNDGYKLYLYLGTVKGFEGFETVTANRLIKYNGRQYSTFDLGKKYTLTLTSMSNNMSGESNNYAITLGQASKSLTNAFDEKANSTDVYTKTEIDNMVGNINNALNLI